MKVLSAICATSTDVKRLHITFDDKGTIVDVTDMLNPSKIIDYYFDDQCLLFAGMGDVHIHAREDVSGKNNYKEDFSSAYAAMKNGGLCHAGDMPNNPIPPIDNKSYEDKFHLAKKVDHCIWFYAGIGPHTRPLSYPVPYKVYMGPSIGELFFKDLKTLDETLSHYVGQAVSFHCEDPEVLEKNKDRPHHHLRRPIEAETLATKDALMLIEKYHLKGKLCHYSTAEGLNLIRAARDRGVDVSIEVTPQHLYYDIEQINEKDWGAFQMNPPIRFLHDKTVLLEALKNGEIQYLATDHAPHTLEEKQKGISGLTGLDTYAGFVTWLLSSGVSPQMIAKVAAENPGDFHNKFLPTWNKLRGQDLALGRVGYLRPGFQANFTILNTQKPQTITTDDLKTKVKHGPFVGVTFPGRLECLFIKGQKV